MNYRFKKIRKDGTFEYQETGRTDFYVVQWASNYVLSSQEFVRIDIYKGDKLRFTVYK